MYCLSLRTITISTNDIRGTSVPENNINSLASYSPFPLRRSTDGNIFKFLPKKSYESKNKTVVQCVMINCEQKILKLKDYRNSSSNFITH